MSHAVSVESRAAVGVAEMGLRVGAMVQTYANPLAERSRVCGHSESRDTPRPLALTRLGACGRWGVLGDLGG